METFSRGKQYIIVTVLVQKGQCYELFMAVFSVCFAAQTHLCLTLLLGSWVKISFPYSLVKDNPISGYTDSHNF